MYSNTQQELKKLVAIGLIFGLTLFVVDLSFGWAIDWLFDQQRGGKYFRLTQAIERVDTEIVIYGSSHAAHHYQPEVFTNELDRSTYNAGAQGQKIFFHNILNDLMLQRYRPKLVILNLDYNWLYQNTALDGHLADLYPYYKEEHREILKGHLQKKDRFIDLKMASNLLRYNSTLVHVLRNIYFKDADTNGYVPLHEAMRIPRHTNSIRKLGDRGKLDPDAEDALIDFIQRQQQAGIQLVFTISPSLSQLDLSGNRSFARMLTIIQRYKVPLFDFTNHQQFVSAYPLFADRSHLNDRGSALFSRLVADKIKTLNEFQSER